MITITSDDFRKYSGISLEIEIPDLDDNSNKITRTISLWTNRVYNVMRASSRRVPKDEELSEFQKESIKNAICEYGMYYLRNGDLYRQSGFDEDKGKLADINDIERVHFPIICSEMLRRAGLIKRAIGITAVYNQDLDSYYR